MTRFPISVVVVVVALSALASADAQTISGRVLNAATGRPVTRPYVSEDEPRLGREELRAFLRAQRLLEEVADAGQRPSARYWPGDKAE